VIILLSNMNTFSPIEVDRLSIGSTTYIWWYNILYIPTCGGISVQDVLIFHTVIPALQQVAAGSQIRGMKQGGVMSSPVHKGIRYK
jgi:hypothetical protein